MKLRAYLNDVHIGHAGLEQFIDLPITAMIYDVCANDQVIFQTELTPIEDPPYPIQVDTYEISPTFTLAQRYHLCPITCSIAETGTDFVPEFVTYFNKDEDNSPYPNPSVEVNTISTTIATSNTFFDGKPCVLDIICVSERSTHPTNREAVTQISILFRDVCYDTIISPPVVAGGDAYLYSDFVRSIGESYHSLDCGPIYYKLEPISSDATVPTGFTIVPDAENGGFIIVAQPDSRDNIGTYNMQIIACTMVGVTEVCQQSNTLANSQITVQVKDPCVTDGQIIKSSWSDELKARQLEVDSTDLSVLIPSAGGSWPWFINVEAELGGDYCGRILYSVSYLNGDLQDLVSLEGDELVFRPDLSHAPGIYKLRLNAWMEDYGIVTTVSVPFDVEVLACKPNLDGSLADANLVDFVNIVWGSATQEGIDLSSILADYT